MRFINKYAARDSEEPIAGTETENLTPNSVERGKGIVFCQACLWFIMFIMFNSLEKTSALNTANKWIEDPR